MNSMTNKGLFVTLICLIIACSAGCVAPASVSYVDADEIQRREDQLFVEQKAVARQQQLDGLLANAKRAYAMDKLMTPAFDNAYNWYQQVLELDVNNDEAHDGMQLITARYLQLAERAFNKGQMFLAQKMLTGAERVAAHPDTIKSLRERYNQRPMGEDEGYLPLQLLSARGEGIQQHLKSLAKQLKPEQRILIVARNDSEGRWIYKQMKEAVDGFRLRGNIEIGRFPKVEVIDL